MKPQPETGRAAVGPSDRPRVVVIGNVLVDEVVSDQGRSAGLGGAGLNSALWLGRRGAAAVLSTRLALDSAGRAARVVLHRAGVSLVEGDPLPTTPRALVRLEGGSPRFQFSERRYPGFAFGAPTVRAVAGSDAVIVNAFDYEDQLQLAALHSILAGAPGWRVLDPNVRPGLFRRRRALLASLEAVLSLAEVVKVSDDDLEALGGETGSLAPERLLEAGAGVVFLTRGREGALVLTAGGTRESVPAALAESEVVDTVGAGDAALVALVLSVLGECRRRPDRERLEELDWSTHLWAGMRGAGEACRQRGGPGGLLPRPVKA